MGCEEFEWDDTKNRENQIKHGVSFEEAVRAFFDPNRVIMEDTKHSAFEARFYCMGLLERGVLAVRFSYRFNTIRILGAGYWRRGRRYYEEKNKIHR